MGPNSKYSRAFNKIVKIRRLLKNSVLYNSELESDLELFEWCLLSWLCSSSPSIADFSCRTVQERCEEVAELERSQSTQEIESEDAKQKRPWRTLLGFLRVLPTI